LSRLLLIACSSFRQIPSFGRDTIRRFANNISELKKLAARDFEDLLLVCIYFLNCKSSYTSNNGIGQCAIPVFDGLLSEPHNTAILRLLFTCAHWHGLAKLRMHTNDTLAIFDEATRRIGAEFRAFKKKTCAAFNTRELDRESDARRRGSLKKGQARKSSTTAVTSEQRPRTINIQTFKHHSLGDHPKMIRQFGTLDSISTEPVSSFSF